MKNTTIITASNNNNLILAEEIKESLDARLHHTQLINLVELEIPLYTPKTKEIPAAIKKLHCILEKTDNYIILAPEYNGGIPPILTNFIAWSSKASENWRAYFNQKTAVIGTHSGGGGIHVLAAMRAQLAYLGMNVLGRQIHTNYQKALTKECLEDIINQISNEKNISTLKARVLK